MRYFTSDTHFGHPLVTALRGFLNNGRLRAEYLGIWQAQGRDAAHAWIKQYVRDNQTSFKAMCDIERHENTIIGNINKLVGRDDELWILGDLSYRCTVEHTLDCLHRINCQHLHMIIGNHDRNFRLRSNDVLYADVFETIDDYREIDMTLPLLGDSSESTGRTAPQTTLQTVGMSHFPRLSSMLQEHDDWPGNWNEFADDAPDCEGWLLYGHTHQDVPDGTDPRCVNVGLDAWNLKPVSERQIFEWFMDSIQQNPTSDGSIPCVPAQRQKAAR
ncbi:MAG: hypothetical protein U0L14_08805 [Bifidobacterium ruminantium]|nr:hypothetical protein [Bifidobacterium ruminantium]